MTGRALVGLVRQNLRRGRRGFVLSALGVALGISSLVFFLALSGGVERVVLGKVFPVGQIEIVPKKSSIGGPFDVLSFGGPQVLDDAFVDALKTRREVEHVYRKVKIAFRHRPLPMHDHARIAAKASLAAEAQGRFWEYHDVLIAHRDALDRASLEGYAATVGLDARRFARDLDDPRLEARVSADEKQAARLHVEGTPTAFVNGRRITGAQPLAVYRAAVERALAGR